MKVLFSILLVFIGVPLCSVAQEGVVIDISGDKSTYVPVHFNVTDVADSRTFTTSIGKVNEGPLTLKGGLAAGIKAYVSRAKTDNAVPVNIQINRFEVREKQAGSKRQFELNISIAYYAGKSKLLEYSGSAYAQSVTDAAPYIEQLVKDNINGNLKEFDAWMAKNKETVSAEPVVTVNVFMSGVAEKPGHIAYTKDRKLYMTDFEAEPDESSMGAAATLSGIGMKMQGSTLRNTTKVDVTLTVYFDKSRSWMKPHGKNVTTLQHEQLHFDITAIKACMLKQQIEQAKFSPGNYKEELKNMLAKVQEEAGDMQNAYDRETEHGTIIDEQEKWTEQIQEMKRQQACFR
jgi:hypothetical protein